jgi:hypothetical protein
MAPRPSSLISPPPPTDHHKINLQTILFDGLFDQREDVFFKSVILIQKVGVIHGYERIFPRGPLDESFSGIELNFPLLEELFQPGPLSFQGISLVFKEKSGEVNELLILFPLLSKYKLLG